MRKKYAIFSVIVLVFVIFVFSACGTGLKTKQLSGKYSVEGDEYLGRILELYKNHSEYEPYIFEINDEGVGRLIAPPFMREGGDNDEYYYFDVKEMMVYDEGSQYGVKFVYDHGEIFFHGNKGNYHLTPINEK